MTTERRARKKDMDAQARKYRVEIVGGLLAVALVASGCSGGLRQNTQGCKDTQDAGCTEGYWGKGQHRQDELLATHDLPSATPLSSAPSSAPSPLLPQEYPPGGGVPP